MAGKVIRKPAVERRNEADVISKAIDVIDLDHLSSVGHPCLIDWRGHRFEIIQVTEVVPGYLQCLLSYLDEPGRLPLSVPAHDLGDAITVTE